MRIRLLIVFLLVGFIGNSQIRYLHPWYHFENKVTVNDLFADSVFYAPLIDTGTYTPSRIGAITIHNTGSAYIWNGTAWVILAGAADGNNYPSSMSFSGGILTVPRNGLSDLTATIDGRYLKISDTSGIWLTETTANNIYSPVTHSHVATDISDLTSYVRNLFTGGTGITYNDSTGVISWNGSASGITSLNGLTGTTQTFTEGYGQNISSAGTAHTFTVDTVQIASNLRVDHVIDSLVALMAQYKTITSFNSDTTNKWVQDVYARNDSLFKYKNGTETFIDSVGGSGGGGGDYNLIQADIGTLGEAVVVARNDSLLGRRIVGQTFIALDTLTTGEIYVRLDTANADLKTYIALYGNDGGGGSDVIDSIQTTAYDSLMTGNFAFNTSLRRLTFKSDSSYIHFAITDSVVHTTSGGSSYDSDAEDFFTRWETAAGSTMDAGDKDAFNTFFLGLKSNSLDTKFASGDIAPFWGGTAATNAVTLWGNNTITFNGGPTHTATGTDWDAVDDYAATDWVANVSGNASSVHMYYYSGENFSSQKIEMGVLNTTMLSLRIHQSGSTYLGHAYSTSITTTGAYDVNTSGGYLVNKESDTKLFWQRNGVTGNINTTSNTAARPGLALWIGALNNGGAFLSGTARECRFSSWGLGFTEAEATTYNTLVETLQDALGRGVQ